MYLSFSHPSFLMFLFLIPFLIFLHFFSLRNLKSKSLEFANFEAIARIKGIDLYSKNLWSLILNILFVLFLSFAVSGVVVHKEMDSSSFSFVIAIDSSQSMEALDLPPNRLLVAKDVAIDFVKSLPRNSRVGVISFSGNTYIESDITTNKEKIIQAIKNIEISQFSGTDIYEAVNIGVGMLKKENGKALILLSDGQINTGDITNTINFAKENNVMIHSIGIGTEEGGEVSYGLSRLDENTLSSLAYNTGGKYFNVTDRLTLEKSFDEISRRTTKIGEIELANYLIIIVMILFVFKEFLVNTGRII